ncbi:exocyst complex component EXO70E2 [Mercurialis annua]|uniref:exocyst complex component EXO70E2 n=1 Tax=Mercurialis annua TaxID=3986 RepID=UPI002160231B|nr:exocyst complex component EXO70E2 [Mercurialis annua]
MHNQSIMPAYEAEQHIVAATQHILKVLGASKCVSDDIRSALKELDSHLSSLSIINENNKGSCEFTEIEKRLNSAQRKVMHWNSIPSPIWDSGPVEAAEYLQAVNDILSVIQSLEGLSSSNDRKARDISFQAENFLQIAMLRLEEELCQILVRHKQCLKLQYVSFRSPAQNIMVYDESYVSVEVEDETVDETSHVEDGTVEETSPRDRSNRESIEYTADLVDPRIISDIKSIANVMSASNHVEEFCEAFIGVRREALYEYLSELEIGKFSIEDVLKLEWDRLDSEIKKWMWAMKTIIREYLASEKRLCDQILGDFTLDHTSYCFIEISKDSILCLLNFGQAVAMGPRKPEKLFRLFDMYEVLTKIHLATDALFSEDNSSFIRIEFHELLSRLGDSARETFFKFGDAISSNASVNPLAGGKIHPLIKYVMNFMSLFPLYCDTMNLLLKDQNVDESDVVAVEKDDEQDISSSIFCPMACHLRSITCALEANLVNKANLYKDESLRHIFLINNIHYMVEKVKDSELRLFFGDEWIRKHTAKCQQHATSYVRATWSSIVSILRDNTKASSSAVSTQRDDRKTWTKEKIEKCRRFTSAFEEVYKSQTQWLVLDLRLRDDLQILTLQGIAPAYRNFLGKDSDISNKYVKYSADDLEKMLLDFFAGSPGSLRNSRRR